MKKVFILIMLVFIGIESIAAKKVLLFVNTKNNCLGCNVGINNLLGALLENKVNTTLYFKGITPFQKEKFRKEIDFNIDNFEIINSYLIYENDLYSITKSRANDSYLIVLENDQLIYRSNLIKLIETPSELKKLKALLFKN